MFIKVNRSVPRDPSYPNPNTTMKHPSAIPANRARTAELIPVCKLVVIFIRSTNIYEENTDI